MKSECKSWLAVARFSGVLMRHRDTKSINWGLHWSLSRKVGGGFVGIMKIALNTRVASVLRN